MLGLYVGGVYIATLWLGAVVLLVFVIVCGRIMLDDTSVEIYTDLEFKELSFKSSLKKIVTRFAKIGFTFIAVTFCMLTLIKIGFLDRAEFLYPLAKALNLPFVVIPAIATYIASPIVGFSMFGSLLQSGTIHEKDAILSLLVGSVFMLPILYARFYFPRWISIFGLKLGLIRGLISLSLIMTTRTVVLLIFLAVIK